MHPSREELLLEALPTLPTYRKAMIPSWAVWSVRCSHYRKPYWWRMLMGYALGTVSEAE